MEAPAIQTLSPTQIELLVMLTFEHLAQSQKTILPRLGSPWQREQLQTECGRLVELGWLSATSDRWVVPEEFHERVARYAWRNGLIPERLNVTPRDDGSWVTFEPPKAYAIRGQFLEILQLNPCESGLIAVLGKGLLVPAEGQEQLAQLLHSLSGHIVGDLPSDPDLSLGEQLQKVLEGC